MLPRSWACTPQSIRICLSPLAVGTVRRKKSPKPTRNMRTRNPFTLLLEDAGDEEDARRWRSCDGPRLLARGFGGLVRGLVRNLGHAWFRLFGGLPFRWFLCGCHFHTPACNRPKLI